MFENSHYSQPGAPGGPNQPGPMAPEMPSRRGEKDAESGERPSKKALDRNRKLAIAFAVAVAAVGGYTFYAAQAPSTYVVVAKDPLAAGATVDVAKQLTAVPVDEEAVQKSAIRGNSPEAALTLADEELKGMRAQFPIDANQQIGKTLFNVEMNLDSQLEADERLVSIRASVADAVAGNIVPGDKVDIVGSTEKVSGVVLSDVPVVAVTVSENQYQAVSERQTGENRNARADELLPTAPVPGIYVVRVKDADMQKLVAVNNGGSLSLIYRPKSAEGAAAADPISAEAAICMDSGVKGCD